MCGAKVGTSYKKRRLALFDTTEIEQQLSWPVSYCVAFDGGMRDVTARYASQWLTETKKLRIKYVEKDTNWWKETCDIWPSRHKELENDENKELKNNLKQQGMCFKPKMALPLSKIGVTPFFRRGQTSVQKLTP